MLFRLLTQMSDTIIGVMPSNFYDTSLVVIITTDTWSYGKVTALFRGYPAKRALCAMRKHGG